MNVFIKGLLGYFLILLLTDGVAAETIKVKKLSKRDWVAVTSENFAVITDAGVKKGQEMAEELERFRFFISQILGYKQKKQESPITVFLAKSNSTYSAWGINKKFVGIFTGNGQDVTFFANSKGFSSSAGGRANIGRQVILHEMVHLLMHNSEANNLLAMPVWYMEGIAEYFGTYVEKKGQVLLGDISLVGDRFYDLWQTGGRGLESIDVESLLKEDYRGRIENASGKDKRYIDKFYARSFALVHYLNASPERQDQLMKYLYVIKKGYPIAESFKAVFELTYTEMDAKVADYLNGKFVSARVFNMGGDGVNFPDFDIEAKPLTSREALTIMVPKIQMLGMPFISESDKQGMYDDLEALYPDFF